VKILYIHNNYKGDNSGEEHAAEGIVKLLEENGHTVEWYRRSSTPLVGSSYRQFLGMFSALWNPFAVKSVKEKLKTFQPDVVQIQNLYPLISPAIIRTIKKAGIPLVIRCPNYRLFCPNGMHLDRQGKVCEQCLTQGREMHCVLKNCENNYFKSLAYALRNVVARKIWGITQNIDGYIVQSGFQKQKFIQNGIPSEKIVIIPGLTPNVSNSLTNEIGTFVSFVGRVSYEKGITEFIEAARHLPEIPFKVAGSIYSDFHIPTDLQQNIEFVGFKNGTELNELYMNSRIIVVPSKWYEGFPNVITRGMLLSKPIITTNIGAMASIVDNGINGILVPPNDTPELQKAIAELYPNVDLCLRMGKNAKETAEKEFSGKQDYNLLIEMYEKASALKF
jgi:glycosyltransferase involved in cell wall biosynthesis